LILPKSASKKAQHSEFRDRYSHKENIKIDKLILDDLSMNASNASKGDETIKKLKKIKPGSKEYDKKI